MRRRAKSHPRPRALTGSDLLASGASKLEVVPLRAIVGTVEPTTDFDFKFRPASNGLRHRWERIALGHRKGQALPPVVLRRQPDGYYVVDGRHRVSVARALRHPDIDAWVTGPRLAEGARSRGSEPNYAMKLRPRLPSTVQRPPAEMSSGISRARSRLG